MNDDKPYRLLTAAGEIAELPVHWSLDDWLQYAFLPDPPIGQQVEPPQKVVDMWKFELDAMRRHGCLFMLTCHPFLSGRPSRVEALRGLIEHAIECGDVTIATAAEVAAEVCGNAELPVREPAPIHPDPEDYPDP